ncbi:hypothetical protein UFOVP967_19 [uncultured Caudovirales phage]|uniref:Uncharacterized protein n=1 Tax=uncultured Caudovirales phage TaxID=2100421 RepID=A0A6J5RLD9_9CAUD|nr:hypothetical protein UFOVP521_97 [uncultured Caudovirales phage]CAB4167892.1 hypothetical protein UFOVP856_69 [uncultured Caudovirales phage]CAB4173996.1 hypothetical protein UFOVP967_19 [uncultured Caudovirales phage]CAB4180613.1 hypothetical protein UFOVP1036_62 [uncultured Caudovirales phage]CAB4186046.1 hypothetical protein UFOVP1132_5 [uncultured Caudovirales phage]
MPLEQLGQNLSFYTFFVSDKTGKTGLSVVADIYRNGTKILSDQSTLECGGGLYKYVLSSTNVNIEGEYIAIFKSVDPTVDIRHIPTIWAVNKAGIEYLDAAVSSRADAAYYTSARGTALDILVQQSSLHYYELEIIDPSTGFPVSGVVGTLSTDYPGSNVVSGPKTTDMFGKARFHVDAGTYYLFLVSSEWNFSNPTQVTVI